MSHASASLVLLAEEDEREPRPDGDRPGASDGDHSEASTKVDFLVVVNYG